MRLGKIDGNQNDPLGMGAMLKKFLEDLAVKNFSLVSIDKRRGQLNEFIRWAEDRSLQRVNEINRPILQRYQRHLFYKRTVRDTPLSFRSQYVRLSSIRSWFAWLTRNNFLLSNPASELELPKLGNPLPKHVLTHEEAETILNQTDVTTALGLRDRSMLETLYSTGLRRMELVNLQIYDMEVSRGVVIVRHGKGNRDRVVPIGQRALLWAERYRNEVRPELLANPNETAFYLGKDGQGISGPQLGDLVHQYIKAADIGKQGSCHLFRHSMATAMLENGADIRFIQSMLGHAKLETTQIYTRVSIRKLQEIHEATHPAKLSRQNSPEKP